MEGLFMREIMITYQLSEENEKRLQTIIGKYKEQGINMTINEAFEFIMITGSVHEIDNKFRFHERMLGLIE